MVRKQNFQDLTQQFICTQVIGRGLDERTSKAYELDLELFYLWVESNDNLKNRNFPEYELETKMELYLQYLLEKRCLRFSTIRRKQLVLGYYLSYLAAQGIVNEFRPLKSPIQLRKLSQQSEKFSCNNWLSKKEIDTFFQAIDQEYKELDSDFRRRVCLRDQIMMKLLFYHGIEISELLRIEISDYNQKTSILKIRKKRENIYSTYLFSHVLQEQMISWLEKHEYFEQDERYCNYMFLSKLGKPLSMKMVINIFDKYRLKAGIKKEYKPKDLKNSLGRYAEEMMKEMC